MTARRRLAAAVLMGAATLGGCDIPTEAPVLESRWVVPGLETALAVTALLPEGVATTSDGGAFVVEMDPVRMSSSLGQLCDACRSAEGLTVPKPAFDAALMGVSTLPAAVRTARLASSTIDLRASHDFLFDPLRPGAGERGTMVLSVRAGSGALLAADTVRGSQTAFPPGRAITRTLTLPAGVDLASSLVVETRLISPDGAAITMRQANELTVTGVAAVHVAEATVDVGGKSVALEATSLDVEDVDADIVDRVEGGAFLLEVANPWGIGLDMSITLEGGDDGPITRPLTIPPSPLSHLEVELTGAEIRSFLGRPGITLTGSGTVPGTSGAVRLTPSQAASIDADLALTLRVGG